jgi:hypothetical protein
MQMSCLAKLLIRLKWFSSVEYSFLTGPADTEDDCIKISGSGDEASLGESTHSQKRLQIYYAGKISTYVGNSDSKHN